MTTTRPPRVVNTPRRAKAFTIGLFACVLAGAFLTTREAPPPALGEVIKPTGWQVGFAPPKGWKARGETLAPHDGRMRTFTTADERRRVSLGRIPVEADQSAESICREVLNELNILAFVGTPRDVHISDAKLGDWPGVLLEWTPEFMGEIFGDHVFVLGAITPSAPAGSRTQAYVLQFHSPAPVSDKDLRLWTLLVESVVTRGEPP